jgi:hypothetical protein
MVIRPRQKSNIREKDTVRGELFTYSFENHIDTIFEMLKHDTHIHIMNKNLPMSTRMYSALTHYFIQYQQRIHDNNGNTIKFEVHVAARLSQYIHNPVVYLPFSADVIVELIKYNGVLTGLLEYPSGTLISNNPETIYNNTKWLTLEETEKLINDIKENNEKWFK